MRTETQDAYSLVYLEAIVSLLRGVSLPCVLTPGGHMAKPRESRNPDGSGSFRLEVWGCRSHAPVRVRILSDKIFGVMTHWKAGGSVYCAGEGQCAECRRAPWQWKGYFAGEVYDQSLKVWIPRVIEVTENCELDFRDRFRRGQVWEMFKERVRGDKFDPVSARLVGEIEPEKLRPAFDFLPVLLTLFHVASIPRTASNPLPPRIFLEPSKDDEGAPILPSEVEPKSQLSDEQLERWSREREARRKLIAEGKIKVK